MSSGANLVKTVTQSAMRWWRATRGQARDEQPLVSNRRLADAVLSRADPVSARAQVHHDMLRMMRYFSVDPGRVPPRFSAALCDAEQLCAHCLVVGRCQHWLHGWSDDAPRSFCPTAELYQEIALSQRQASDSDEPPTA